MPSTRDLRRRIRSVKNTAQITKAMQMVSATKMRRAQIQALGARPYNQTLSSMLGLLVSKSQTLTHPLILPNESTSVGVLVLSTDKGLCGALNTNLIRTLLQSEPLKNKQITYYTFGKKVRDFLIRSQKDLAADFETVEKIDFSQATQMRKLLVTDFLEGKIGEVYILFPDFVSTLRQEPKLTKVLPIDSDQLLQYIQQNQPDPKASSEFIIEPNVNQILDYILVHFLDMSIYQALLELKASEHSARMIAMQNATTNAKELVTDLQLTYNQLRQTLITTQILEIASAGAA